MRSVCVLWCVGALCFAASCRRKTPVAVADAATDARAADGRYISWKERLIDGEESGKIPIRGAVGLAMADLDRDGFPDIVSAHRESNHVRLAFGSANPAEWFLLTLGEGSDAGAVADVAIGDLNGDGFPDVVAACEKGHLVYFQNPGGKVRGWPWRRTILSVTAGRGSWSRVFLADLNRDGKQELVACNQGAGSVPTPISLFEIPAVPLDGAAWRERELGRFRAPVNCQPVDFNGDGYLDIFAGSREEGRIFRLENSSSPRISFRESAISVAGAGFTTDGSRAAFHDLNGGGRLDVILSTSQRTVVWLEQPADPAKPWTPHLIGTLAPDEPAGIAVADIDGDGRPDVIAGTESLGPHDKDGEGITVSDPVGRLAWFQNPGDASAAWKRHDILRIKRGMYAALIPFDVNGDGNMDFVATRGNSDKYDGVFWLEQFRSKRPGKAFTPARKSESGGLPASLIE